MSAQPQQGSPQQSNAGQPVEADDAPPSWRVEYPEPIRRFMHHDASDQFMHISLQLAAELWVVKRRLAEVETQLLNANVITSPDQVRREPDYAFDHADRDRFIHGVFGVLLGPGD